MIKESADLIYNLVVIWVSSGIQPKEVWKEMERRERLLGIAEKLPKDNGDADSRRKVVTLGKPPRPQAALIARGAAAWTFRTRRR